MKKNIIFVVFFVFLMTMSMFAFASSKNENEDTIQAPVASVKSGTYYEPISVTFINGYSKKETIYYTLDGKAPIVPLLSTSNNSNKLIESKKVAKVWDGKPIAISKSTVLKAAIVKRYDHQMLKLSDKFVSTGNMPIMKKSKVATYKYIIKAKPVETPVATHTSGKYTEPIKVTFKDVPSTNTIYYTTNGKNPTIIPGSNNVDMPLFVTNSINPKDITDKSKKDVSPYMPPKNPVLSTYVWKGEPIVIDKTTTLKAIAVETKGNVKDIITARKSKVVTYKYVIIDVKPGLGDINLDGKVTKEDVNLLMKYITGGVTFTDQQKVLADVNKDKKINITDSVLIQRLISMETMK